MDAPRPFVSVIIPCRNEEEHIEPCIQAVLSQDAPAGGFEVIVADGASTDGTRAILERVAASNPRLRVIDNPRQIVSTGLNAALRSARGDVIVRMDAHTQYATDYLSQCVNVLLDTGADNVGGPWVAHGTTLMGRAIAAAFQSPFGCGGARGHDRSYEGPVDTVYLGCWPRRVFDALGTFDEELVRNQDDEFNFRLTLAGCKVWQSRRIRSLYLCRDSLRMLMRQYLQYGYWKVRVLQKHRRPASLRHIVPGSFVVTLLALLVLSFFWSSALFLLAGVLLPYAALTIIASAVTAGRQDWRLFIPLLAVFPSYHLSYGTGFALGVLSTILRSPPAPRFVTLTRSPP